MSCWKIFHEWAIFLKRNFLSPRGHVISTTYLLVFLTKESIYSCLLFMRWFSSELGLSIIPPTRARVTIVNKRAIFNWVSKVIQVCLGITSVSFVSLPRKLVPPAHPMRFYQPWANCDLITRAFPLFRPFPSIISEFPLAVYDIYICPDWLLWLPWYCCYGTPLESALARLHSFADSIAWNSLVSVLSMPDLLSEIKLTVGEVSRDVTQLVHTFRWVEVVLMWISVLAMTTLMFIVSRLKLLLLIALQGRATLNSTKASGR